MTRLSYLAAAALAASALGACHGQTATPSPTPTASPASEAISAQQDRAGRHGREVTREDYVARADRKFAKLDTDHDGTLSSDELAARHRRGGNRADTGARPARSITRAEFQQRAEQRFARLDINNDGRLDATERQARHGGKHRRDREVGNDAGSDIGGGDDAS